MINHFKTLGVHRRSTEEEIHERYKDLAWEHHPDRGGVAADFAAIGEAYAILRTKATLARYIAELKLYCAECGDCSGLGAKSRSKGFTNTSYKACPSCEGAGYIIRSARPGTVVYTPSTTLRRKKK